MIIFSPSFLMVESAGLVPKCNTIATPETTEVINGVTVSTHAGFKDPCDFNMLMTLINTVISFLLIDLATPIFVLILIYVAWLYLSDMGSSENISKAKKILKNAFIGYIIALAAWLIVKTILTTLGFEGETFLSSSLILSTII